MKSSWLPLQIQECLNSIDSLGFKPRPWRIEIPLPHSDCTYITEKVPDPFIHPNCFEVSTHRVPLGNTKQEKAWKPCSSVESHFTPQLQLLPTTSDVKYNVFFSKRMLLAQYAVNTEAANWAAPGEITSEWKLCRCQLSCHSEELFPWIQMSLSHSYYFGLKWPRLWKDAGLKLPD